MHWQLELLHLNWDSGSGFALEQQALQVLKIEVVEVMVMVLKVDVVDVVEVVALVLQVDVVEVEAKDD